MDDTVLRIGNCSGFYGDRFEAPREMLEGGALDYLTGDYLAELTMLILWRARAKDPEAGYAKTFLSQMEECLGLARDKGVRIVTNAGGLNPAGLAEELRRLADRLGVDASVAHIQGDDLLPRLDAIQGEGHDLAHLSTGQPFADMDTQALTANAYLGSWGIVAALDSGADVVVCPRVTDAALVIGPTAHNFGWSPVDWDRLAGALVAGHVLECGAQATGGNYSFFQEVPGLTHPGFPVAEMHADGTAIITKHDQTGGEVSVGTVTAQLLYEIGGPRYVSPDVVARFDTIQLEQVGQDRVRISGVRGEPAPAEAKVGINYLGGFRNEMTFVLTGLDIEAKADLVKETLAQRLDLDAFDDVDIRLLRGDREDPQRNEDALAHLRVVVKDRDATRAGRAFSRVPVELALASYPGFTMTRPPEDASPFGVFWPTLVPKSLLEERVITASGEERPIKHVVPDEGSADVPPQPSAVVDEATRGQTRRAPLGRVAGARSGDKGGDANIGVWARTEASYAWLDAFLTVERLRELLPETADLHVERFRLPNLLALNFVVHGILGEGVSSSTRPDPQAKGLGEYLRARHVDVPVEFLT